MKLYRQCTRAGYLWVNSNIPVVDVNEFHKSFRPIDSFIMETAKIAIKIIDITQLSWLVSRALH